ncbi:MAG: hypothetical protein ABR898_12390 [Terracidiphilus sp.]
MGLVTKAAEVSLPMQSRQIDLPFLTSILSDEGKMPQSISKDAVFGLELLAATGREAASFGTRIP